MSSASSPDLTTEADHRTWSREQLRPYIDHVVEHVRTRPHSLWRRLAGVRTGRRLPPVADDTRLGDRRLFRGDKRKLFRDNAVKAYRLNV